MKRARDGLPWPGERARRGLSSGGWRASGLRPILRATLLAVANTTGIERTTDHMVPHAGQILHTAAANQDDRVLLQIVTFARDVRRDFHLVGEPHPGDLPKGRVRLLRGHRPDLETHAPLL